MVVGAPVGLGFPKHGASRETELLARFPSKDVSAWLGNSVPVALRHYAMATRVLLTQNGLPLVHSELRDDGEQRKRRSRTRKSVDTALR